MTTFSDDFNRANSTDLGAGWVEVSGDWSIVSNQLSSGSAGGVIILRAAGAMATNDNSAQVTIAATAAVSHGVWCRGNTNISQGYLWRNDGTSWNLFSVVGGSFTSIGSFAGAAVAGDVAKIQAVGSTIKGYVNGVQRVSVTDTAVATGTSVGIRSESTSALRFDDFTAADVTAGATLGVATGVEAAQPFTGSKAATLGAAGEASAAQPLAGGKSTAAGTAGAAEAAQPLTGTKAAGILPAAGQGTAQALAGGKAAQLGIAGTVESAQPPTGTKTAALAPAAEEDTAQAVAGGTPSVLGVAESVEVALPLVGAKTAALTPALEVDAARPLTVPSTTVPSPERTFRIRAEHRQLTVVAERRRLAVAAEHRTLIVRR